MRKADYAVLASLIAQHLRALRLQNDAAAGAAVKHIEELAREFATRANVDRVAFLVACNVT